MKALILVDLQNDFVEPGALPVPGGAEVVAYANRIMHEYDLVVATQDWHPSDHLSFASQHPGLQIGDTFDLNGMAQVAWPDHCVQSTFGAQLLDRLERGQIDSIFTKGTDRNIDSYSGFFDNGHLKATGLGDFLTEHGVTEVSVMGLATDYCVRFTALDAMKLGFKTHLLLEGCRGVELRVGDIQRAIEEMRLAGVRVIEASPGSLARSTT